MLFLTMVIHGFFMTNPIGSPCANGIMISKQHQKTVALAIDWPGQGHRPHGGQIAGTLAI
jgi:hypothetical protein